ncbi:MAG TPA: GNAT family N-acetyltransferase [Acidobacteriaceae bacterium]|nr:GNAT family N-acetyltransferase [Acidobacteriaceae bacterium]
MQIEPSPATIVPVDDARAASASRLLVRFFAEEGFAGDEVAIASRFDVLRRDPHHWAALALHEDGHPVGIVTVTTMLYVEWGRMAEIGDLYVLPEHRDHGIARALVEAAVTWSRGQGCSAVEVVMTPAGEASHGLSRFYKTLGFAETGRTISLMHLNRALD